MTASPSALRVLALDPGPAHTGWAILSVPEILEASGTWIPRRTLSTLDRHLWLVTKLQDLIGEWQPGLLAYEEFVWRTGQDGQAFVRGRPAMERLVGAIQALMLHPPYPVLMPLKPGQWGKQLTGSTSHDKGMIARAVNLRLGTSFTGDTYDNHQADSVGLGLVALDTYTLTMRLNVHAPLRLARRRA